MKKEEIMLQKRLTELSYTAYQRGIVTFSNFLNMNELNILHSIPRREFSASYETYGGYELSERQMVAFLPDAFCYEYEYPISYLEIAPLQTRFAEDLNHRDYLGALLNLGIDRSKLGDILLMESQTVLICHQSLEQFICDELTKVRHTQVKCKKIPAGSFDYKPNVKKVVGSVASLRLDSLMALAFSASRSSLVSLIESGRVFVNGKMITSNGFHIKSQDIVSVRGYGRFRYIQTLSETKKGRYMAELHLYI